MLFEETPAVNQHSRDPRYSSYHALIKPLSKYELLQPRWWPMNIPTATEINTRASCALSAVILTSYHTVIKHYFISDQNEVLSLNRCHLSPCIAKLVQIIKWPLLWKQVILILFKMHVNETCRNNIKLGKKKLWRIYEKAIVSYLKLFKVEAEIYASRN